MKDKRVEQKRRESQEIAETSGKSKLFKFHFFRSTKITTRKYKYFISIRHDNPEFKPTEETNINFDATQRVWCVYEPWMFGGLTEIFFHWKILFFLSRGSKRFFRKIEFDPTPAYACTERIILNRNLCPVAYFHNKLFEFNWRQICLELK